MSLVHLKWPPDTTKESLGHYIYPGQYKASRSQYDGPRDQTWSMVKRPMGQVRMGRVDHYKASAISSNLNTNMLQLIAGDIWYPKVLLSGSALGMSELYIATFLVVFYWLDVAQSLR